MVHEQIDTDLLTCTPTPAIPPHGATLADWKVYTIKLWVAGQDCRGRLDAIRQLQQKDAKQ